MTSSCKQSIARDVMRTQLAGATCRPVVRTCTPPRVVPSCLGQGGGGDICRVGSYGCPVCFSRPELAIGARKSRFLEENLCKSRPPFLSSEITRTHRQERMRGDTRISTVFRKKYSLL